MDSQQPTTKTGRIFILNADDPKKLQQYRNLLWPNSDEKHRSFTAALDGPLKPFHQSFFICDLGITDPTVKTQITNYIHACQQYSFNTLNHDIQRSQHDWFHALFFNYNLCEMNTDLDNAIAFILRKYEPLREIANSEMQWHFIKKTFSMVAKQQSAISIKIFLLLSLVSWEAELESRVQKLFTTPRARKNYSFCLPHIKTLMEGVVLSPYTRNNISYIIEFFIYQATRLCHMNIVPNINALVEQYHTYQQQLIKQQQFDHTGHLGKMNLNL